MIALIASSTPENGATGVGLSTPITLQFAENIKWIDVGPSNFSLQNTSSGEALTIESSGISVDAVTKTVVLTPIPSGSNGALYDGLTSYVLTVTGLRLYSGAAVPESYEFRFTTTEESDSAVPAVLPSYPEFRIVYTNPSSGQWNYTPTAVTIRLSQQPERPGQLDVQATLDEITSVTDVYEPLTTVLEAADPDAPYDIVLTLPTLEDNAVVTVIITGCVSMSSLDVLPDQMFSFHTKVSPAFIGLRYLKAGAPALQKLMVDMTPETVWDLIQDSSQYVVQLAEDRSVTTFDADAPDTYAQALVRAKARFEIVYAKILDLGLDVTSKSLGDLAISNQRMIQDLERLAAQYKRVWQQAEDAFLGYRVGHAMPKVFVKGADVREDPDFMNRKFSSIDGTTKSW